MTVQQCNYVLKIAACGSFNEAAKELFVAQSSLSVSVKALEQELGIRIFHRAGSGVYLTEEGAEFARYARQLTQQHAFVLNRYQSPPRLSRLYVSTQHYDFVADIFARLINTTKEDSFRFSLREMKAYDVIHETETALCDVGIIAIKGSDYGIMERYITKRGLCFTPFLKALPHVFVRREHPLARKEWIGCEDLIPYPYVTYEQGEHSNSYFAEEVAGISAGKQIEISDRASLMNVLLATDGYTLGTGIMPSLLNGDRIVSIPFESDDDYTIGYLLHADRKVSPQTGAFLSMLQTLETNQGVHKKQPE